jgi:hypothetical protein
MPQVRACLEKRLVQRLLRERPCVRVRAAHEHKYVPNTRLPQVSWACCADALHCNICSITYRDIRFPQTRNVQIILSNS